MADGVKMSEFTPINTLQESCCIPTISGGDNRRITYGALKNQLINEMQSRFANITDITNAVTWETSGRLSLQYGSCDYTVSNGSLKCIKDNNSKIVTLWVTVTVTGSLTMSNFNIPILKNLPNEYKPISNIASVLGYDHLNIYSDGTIGILTISNVSSKTYSFGVAYKTN